MITMLSSLLPHIPHVQPSASDQLWTFTLMGMLLSMIISWIAYTMRRLLAPAVTFFMGAVVIIALVMLYPMDIDQSITMTCAIMCLLIAVAVLTSRDCSFLHATVPQPFLLTMARIAFGVIVLGIIFELLAISLGYVFIINVKQTKMVYGAAYGVLLMMKFIMEMKVGDLSKQRQSLDEANDHRPH